MSHMHLFFLRIPQTYWFLHRQMQIQRPTRHRRLLFLHHFVPQIRHRLQKFEMQANIHRLHHRRLEIRFLQANFPILLLDRYSFPVIPPKLLKYFQTN